MRRIGLAILVLAALWLSGCAHRSTFTQEKRQSDFQPAEIQELYIYAFLDARREYMGEALFPVLQKTLSARLQAHGVNAHWLWFEDSPVGEHFSASEQGSSEGYGKMIPVPLVLMLNKQQEEKTKASHRLVIFPKTVGLTGIHQAEREYYASLTWTLSRVTASEAPVFKGSSIFYSRPRRATEDLQRDVDSLVDDFINELYADK
ncbi:hypothetical protein CXK93_20025 [Stutzerimonas decontaminans]|uniref:Lipoprotein n=3 Tax=Stutzerimonas TaxID=2901164 RepID=A0ABX4VT42_9GAMM|nr:hypothetical protein UIB01_16910 [Stutzerimonas decontaminans]MCW8158852.1 hypothetical protein [Stutzerimonas stutzeri]PNF83335.1 hypothetical protein CXK93_20025 [Stutzerimonas decontaminans]